jgi:TolB protein
MNRRTALLTGALVLAAAAAGLVATVGQAKAPAKNGLIAFSRYRYVDSPLREEIWVANRDGSGQRQLTHVGPNYLDSDPDWAPDGSRLVFGRCKPGGRCTVWSVKADGNDPRMLSRACTRFGPNCPEDHGASYSPDGHSLAFVRFTVAGTSTIMISDANLHHARPVFSFGRDKGAPSINPPFWSPDGKQLVFSLCNCNGSRYKPVSGLAMFVINADGSGLRRLTPWSLHAGTAGSEGGSDRIDWSPDGTRILFRTVDVESDDPGPSTGNVYTIRPDGSDVRRITHLPPGTDVQLGSYSPDGSSIVFTTTAGAHPKPDGGGSWPDVFVIKADGTGLVAVTRTKNWEGTPNWGPRT